MKRLRLFIAFASDCDSERRAIHKICQSDRTIKKICLERGISLDYADFTYVSSDVGRPQSLINAAAEKWNPDWFIFLFWRRLGSPAGLGMTGMEEEWSRAIDLNRSGAGHPRVSLFFNQAEGDPYNTDPVQSAKLASFQETIFDKYQALATCFKGPREFRELFHADLALRLVELDQGAGILDLEQELRSSSNGLLTWPRTLGGNEEIHRPELQALLETVRTTKSSTTLILGGPGVGKSALLAGIGNECLKEGFSVLGIKADMLGKEIRNPDDLRRWLNLTLDAGVAVKKVASKKTVVVLVDQLDAVSELVDRRSDRLNVLLNFIHGLSGYPKVHVVASSRAFEARNDVRLNSLNADRVDLTLPTWEKLVPIVARAGYDPAVLTDLTKELLRTPWCLKLFLEIAKPDKVFVTFQSLLEEVWIKRVLADEGMKERVELLEHLAKKMSLDETFWLPYSVADKWPNEILQLEREDILRRGPDGNTIGFRHQTYYDFTLARTFANGSLSLSSHVQRRQDGLFVRPTLLSGIQYLRATSKSEYHRQIKALLRRGVRPHIRSLLIEFLGAQLVPDDVELSMASALLRRENEGPRMLASMAGSPGWFKRIHNASVFLAWMRKPHDAAVHCLNFLCLATQCEAALVLTLLERYWLPRRTCDDLTMRVLSYLTNWTTQAVDIACLILERRVDSNAPLLVDKAAEKSPELASRLLRAAMEGRLRQALVIMQKLKRKRRLSDEEKLTINPSLDGIKGGLIKLIENEEDWYNLDSLAEAAPKPFLDHIWPWFIQVISKIAHPEHEFVIGYRDDPATYNEFDGELPQGPIVKALLVAMTKLAQQMPDQFMEFARLADSSDLLIVQRLLARGYRVLTADRPSAVLSYLIADHRRLEIGDHADCHRESKALIAGLSSSLDDEGMKALQDAVIGFRTYKKILPKWTPKERFERTIRTRAHRLRLLRAFRLERMTAMARTLREEEEQALLNPPDYDGRVIGGWIGPRMTAKEMTKASNDNLMKLFTQMPDQTEGMNPKRRFFEDSSRAGGASQLAREFEAFAKSAPERALALLEQFKPGEQETYAGRALEGLAGTDVSTSELITSIRSLIEKGFSSGPFREGAASALKIRAGAENGLSQIALTILEQWLDLHQEPDLSQHKERWGKDNVKQGREILFGHSSSWGLPHGRGPIVEALAEGYLRQEPPNYIGWANLISARLKKERHPAIWVMTLRRMPSLFNWDRSKATALFDSVIDEHPAVLDYDFALYSIANVIRFAEPKTTAQKWLDSLQARQSDFSQQAYGELLFLYHCCCNDAWSSRHVARLLRVKKPARTILGLAHGASHLWRHRNFQLHATRVLESLALETNPLLVRAVNNVFRLAREEFEVSQPMLRLVRKISRNRCAILDSADDLLELLSPLTVEEPKLVLQVSRSLLRFGRAKFQRYGWTSVPENLTSIAITLHRQNRYRKAGLELFESLIEMNLAAAKEALTALDRTPVTKMSLYWPRRSRRRRAVNAKVTAH